MRMLVRAIDRYTSVVVRPRIETFLVYVLLYLFSCKSAAVRGGSGCSRHIWGEVLAKCRQQTINSWWCGCLGGSNVYFPSGISPPRIARKPSPEETTCCNRSECGFSYVDIQDIQEIRTRPGGKSKKLRSTTTMYKYQLSDIHQAQKKNTSKIPETISSSLTSKNEAPVLGYYHKRRKRPSPLPDRNSASRASSWLRAACVHFISGLFRRSCNGIFKNFTSPLPLCILADHGFDTKGKGGNERKGEEVLLSRTMRCVNGGGKGGVPVHPG